MTAGDIIATASGATTNDSTAGGATAAATAPVPRYSAMERARDRHRGSCGIAACWQGSRRAVRLGRACRARCGREDAAALMRSAERHVMPARLAAHVGTDERGNGAFACMGQLSCSARHSSL